MANAEINYVERTVTNCASDQSAYQESVSNEPSRKQWPNLLAYWLLGLCNNFGYVVMLSAAHDILSNDFNKVVDEADNSVTNSSNNSSRDCNTLSTGALLLADILPSLVVKIFAPFLVCSIHLRVALAVVLSAMGYLLVAFSSADWVAVLGVACTSLSSGLGETSLLSYVTFFHRNAVSTWSSGTGGAGIFGAGSYAGLTALGLKPAEAMLVMLIIPVIMALSFWLLLQHPSNPKVNEEKRKLEQLYQTRNVDETTQTQNRDEEGNSQVRRFKEKLYDVIPLFKYMLPLTAVYLFEYFINQGLFELVQFHLTWLTHKEQYRWLQLIYQIGVFISRSSANIITFRHVWIMAVLQLLNVILVLFQVIYEFIPNIWIVFAIVLWEGLLGGGAYVNTFYRISIEVPEEKREFSMGITTLSDSAGISLAGFISIPVHNILCKLPRAATVAQ